MSKKLNILLVEDDALSVKILQKAFAKLGINHSIEVSANGQEALGLLQTETKSPPDLVLLDFDMPKMNGLDFLKTLRSHDRFAELPVFMLSSNEDLDIRKQAYDLNIAGFILKPQLFDNYVEALETLNSFWELMELRNN